MLDVHPDLKRLKKNPPQAMGAFPPWLPLSTEIAAAFLRVHPKTLLTWYRAGIGPSPVKQGIFVGRQLYWRPGDLIAWWEQQILPPDQARSFEKVCADWQAKGPWEVSADEKYALPPAKYSLALIREMIRPELTAPG